MEEPAHAAPAGTSSQHSLKNVASSAVEGHVHKKHRQHVPLISIFGRSVADPVPDKEVG